MQNKPETNTAHDPAMFGNTMPSNIIGGDDKIISRRPPPAQPEPQEEVLEATGDALILSDALHSIADSIKALSESLLAHTAATNRLADVQERIVAGESTMADEVGIPTHLGQTL